MKTPFFLKNLYSVILNQLYEIDASTNAKLDFVLNVTSDRAAHGDVSSNAALMIARTQGKAPRIIAQEIIAALEKAHTTEAKSFMSFVQNVEIAGPGFLNFRLTHHCWLFLTQALLADPEAFFVDPTQKKEKVLIEFVSANPTGPLHLGHGRGGIIGDVLARVGRFLGHEINTEFYINDAGSQISRLGESLRARVAQHCGIDEQLPENGYAGAYLVAIAEKMATEQGRQILEQPISFFTKTAQDQLLTIIKKNLSDYRITFDRWFSERSLHESGAIKEAIQILENKELVYEQEGALFFRATAFGDDKDRVIQKSDGELTYIAADIAYHKNKFDRGYTQLIDILGQDHHGYVMRLKATMQALGYDVEKLDVILYQLVSIKKGEQLLKMSKRAGNFEQLGDIIELVGADVARFFYLNRKADAHLDFDLDVALKQTDENPVFYIHYAYVRTNSILKRSLEHPELATLYKTCIDDAEKLNQILGIWKTDETIVLKKIWSLHTILTTLFETKQTHILAYYTLELAQAFHHYYAQNHIITQTEIERSASRLVLVQLVRSTLSLCLDLLGLSKPEAM
jgi:arginyl-tRNA synthetase